MRRTVEPVENLHLPSRTYKLIGVITEEAFSKFVDAALVLSQSAEPFTIFLNSVGGSVVDGFAIFDLISNLQNHVTIRVYGEASSMGAIILQAADTRQIARHARMLIHDGACSMSETVARDFDRFATAWKNERKSFYRILSERSGKSQQYFQKRMAHDWFISAQEALTERLVDEIV